MLRITRVLVFWVAAVASVRGEMVVEAGATSHFSFGGLEHELVLYVPSDYTREREWPVVFHYHGTSGKPTVEIPRQFTKGEGFVIVGMEYVERGSVGNTMEIYERELNVLRQVRQRLAGVLKIDPARSYVGGFSKGGWFASAFMDFFGEEFAGGYILGAGVNPRPPTAPKRLRSGTPIYIGAGQLEVNRSYSIQAIEHFKRLGGAVTFEEYLGYGHNMPYGGKGAYLAPSLEQWFAIEQGGIDPEPTRKAASEWMAGLLTRAEEEGDKRKVYLLLDWARKAPFYRVVTQEERDVLDRAWIELGKQPELVPELRARSEYLAVVDRELKGKGMAHRKEMLGRYFRIWETYEGTWAGARAGIESERLREMLSSVDRWGWANTQSRDAYVASLKENPLPKVEAEGLPERFHDLGKWIATGF